MRTWALAVGGLVLATVLAGCTDPAAPAGPSRDETFRPSPASGTEATPRPSDRVERPWFYVRAAILDPGDVEAALGTPDDGPGASEEGAGAPEEGPEAPLSVGALQAPAAVRLPDDRIRIYFAAGGGIRSAVSEDASGRRFTVEPGVRIANATAPSAVPLEDGGVRLFYRPLPGPLAIHAADAHDGRSFVADPEVAVRPGDDGAIALSGPAVVRLPDGLWRMYAAEQRPPSDGAAADGRGEGVIHVLRSWRSHDLRIWWEDRGLRAGPGSPHPDLVPERPTAFRTADGVTVAFRSEPHDAVLWLPSADGLTLAPPVAVAPGWRDPTFVAGQVDSRLLIARVGDGLLVATESALPWTATARLVGKASGDRFGHVVEVAGRATLAASVLFGSEPADRTRVTLSHREVEAPAVVRVEVPVGPYGLLLTDPDGQALRLPLG